ncbi:MAG: hypothetical protein ACRCVT_08250, partial [Leadbetterella sp.]
MEQILFQFYPTLLNEYGKYILNPSPERKQSLLNRINRIPDFDEATMAKFKQGISFEDAVLKDKPSAFPKSIINE